MYLACICSDTLHFALVLAQEQIMNQAKNLSLSEEFQLKKFSDLVQRMSREQAREFLIELHWQMMMKDKMYRHFIKQEWNLG